MIAARHTGNLAARLKRRAEALALRRAHEMMHEARGVQWRDARVLWPDFIQADFTGD
jgi:uncharacterized protein YbjT (DUF2867 family)